MKKGYRILYISQIFPIEMEANLLGQKISPVQTQRFGIALLEAIASGFNKEVDVLSFAPVLDYPHSNYIVTPHARWKPINDINARMIPFINLFIIKHITRFLGTLFYVLYWSIKNADRNKIVITHGVQSCNILGVALGKLASNATIVVYFTDKLGNPLKWEKTVKRVFRKLDVLIMKNALKMVSGAIAMTPWLSQEYAREKPYLLVETIISKSSHKILHWQAPRKDVYKICYAGGLYEEYGICKLLEAFKIAKKKDWRLIIVGYGDREDEIRQASIIDSRIEFKGFLNTQELYVLYESINVLVNPRPLSNQLTHMAFPSKIIEYMGTGKPVISTALPSMGDKLKEHLVIAYSDTPEEIAQRLEEVQAWDIEKLNKWHHNTIKFITENYSPNIQGNKIRSFIVSLTKNTCEIH